MIQAIKAINVKPYKTQEDWNHSAINIHSTEQFVSLVFYKVFPKDPTKKSICSTQKCIHFLISVHTLRSLYQLCHQKSKMLNNRETSKETVPEARQSFDF